MELREAIMARRSIRKYAITPIPQNDIENIILAGMQAPSAKNRQPWQFVVVQGDSKNGMINAMKNGLAREIEEPKLPKSKKYIDGAKYTLGIMEQTPVTIFIINSLDNTKWIPGSWEDHVYEIVNVQSVGACIQNMLLAAIDLGYGSLWNCDIYFAYEEIAQWLNTSNQIVAAVSFGIPAEKPGARPRNALTDLVEWKM